MNDKEYIATLRAQIDGRDALISSLEKTIAVYKQTFDELVMGVKEALPIESPEEKCEHCNGKISSYRSGCPGCGAPMCCQSCCEEKCLEVAEHKGTCKEEKGGWEEEVIKLLEYLNLKTAMMYNRPAGEIQYPEFYHIRKAINKELATAREEGRKEGRHEMYTLYGTPNCDYLNHSKKDYHKSGGECPVVSKILSALGLETR